MARLIENNFLICLVDTFLDGNDVMNMIFACTQVYDTHHKTIAMLHKYCKSKNDSATLFVFGLYCRNNDITGAKIMLAHCHNIDLKEYLRDACCYCQNDTIIQMLIRLGARNYDTGFLCACSTGNVKIAEQMADLGQKDSLTIDFAEGFTEACRIRSSELAYRLASRGQTSQSHLGHMKFNRCLKGACVIECIDLVKLFISYGANRFNGALRIACESHNIELARFLLEQGANKLSRPLASACFYGYHDLIDLIISHAHAKHILLNLSKGVDSACLGKRVEYVQLMLGLAKQSGIKINCNCGIKYACGYCRDDAILKLLIANGADSFNEGFIEACIYGHEDVAKLMIEHGADAFNQGLIMCCRWGQLKMVRFIIDIGTKRNVPLNFNEALFEALSRRHLDIAQLMVQHGATHIDEALNRAVSSYTMEDRARIPEIRATLMSIQSTKCS